MDEKNLHINQMKYENCPEPDIPVDEAWAGMNELLNNNPKKIKPDKVSKPYASNLLGFIGIGLSVIIIVGYYLVREKLQNEAPTISFYTQNQPHKDTLSDGTIVYLDRYSSISEITSIANENVINLKGSAYIQDNKGISVQAHHLKLGSLDVLSQSANIFLSFDTVLAISSVHVQSGTALLQTKESKIILAAGESITYDEKAKRLNSKKEINVNLFSYATRVFEFNNTSLKEVADAIEKFYGVQIIFESKKTYSCRITTRFDNKDLKEVLDIITYTLNLKYYLNEKTNIILLTGNGCE